MRLCSKTSLVHGIPEKSGNTNQTGLAQQTFNDISLILNGHHDLDTENERKQCIGHHVPHSNGQDESPSSSLAQFGTQSKSPRHRLHNHHVKSHPEEHDGKGCKHVNGANIARQPSPGRVHSLGCRLHEPVDHGHPFHAFVTIPPPFSQSPASSPSSPGTASLPPPDSPASRRL